MKRIFNLKREMVKIEEEKMFRDFRCLSNPEESDERSISTQRFMTVVSVAFLFHFCDCVRFWGCISIIYIFIL